MICNITDIFSSIYTCDIGLFVGQYFVIHNRLLVLPIFACDMYSADIYTSNIGWQAYCTNNRYRLYLLYHNFGGYLQFENLRYQSLPIYYELAQHNIPLATVMVQDFAIYIIWYSVGL